jgi:hypothetical protein
MTSETIEWAAFHLKESITEIQLLAASRKLQRQFLDQQDGYIRRDLISLGNRQYADLVIWQSQACADKAMATASQYPACQAYFALITVDAAPKMGQPIQTSHHRHTTGHIGGMEFSLFRMQANKDEKALINAAERMAAGLYAGEPGFIDHFVLRGSNGVYADVVLASSGERANELCQKWGAGPFTEACLPYLEIIDPSSVEMNFWERLR